MKKKDNKKNLLSYLAEKVIKTDIAGYRLNPESEDIYSKFKEEENIYPENISNSMESNVNNKANMNNEKDFAKGKKGSDLDVPDSETDDGQEKGWQ